MGFENFCSLYKTLLFIQTFEKVIVCEEVIMLVCLKSFEFYLRRNLFCIFLAFNNETIEIQ